MDRWALEVGLVLNGNCKGRYPCRTAYARTVEVVKFNVTRYDKIECGVNAELFVGSTHRDRVEIQARMYPVARTVQFEDPRSFVTDVPK